MNDLESVKISDTGRDPRELNMVDWWRGLGSNGKRPHQLQTVCSWIGPCVLLQTPVGHPFRKDAELVQLF